MLLLDMSSVLVNQQDLLSKVLEKGTTTYSTILARGIPYRHVFVCVFVYVAE